MYSQAASYAGAMSIDKTNGRLMVLFTSTLEVMDGCFLGIEDPLC